MSRLIPEMTLANGMTLSYLRKNEAQFLAEEIKEYFKPGIELHEGDTIFDVGANIGVFTLWSYQLCNRNAHVYAFEPIPAIFEVLHHNVKRFDSEKLKAFEYGLSKENKTTTFAYYPEATLWSSAYSDFFKEQIRETKKSVLRNLEATPVWFRWLPSCLRSWMVNFFCNQSIKRVEHISCSLRTLSDVIREYHVQQIDLLKVDVENSELDVLLGIEEHDWCKIRQVIIEVHDLDYRLETITTLLKEHGLSEIAVEQQPVLKNSNIFLLYAKRN